MKARLLRSNWQKIIKAVFFVTPSLAFCGQIADIAPRKVGSGRAARQLGQVRKEAALTGFERVARPAFHLFRHQTSTRA